MKFLDRIFYQDVVEERSGNNCCAYALCDKEIKIKSTKYRISCNFNKVFEISERNKETFAKMKSKFFFRKMPFYEIKSSNIEKYCSDICYRRSMFVLGQLDSTPIWLRYQDDFNPDNIELLFDEIGLPGKRYRKYESVARNFLRKSPLKLLRPNCESL